MNVYVYYRSVGANNVSARRSAANDLIKRISEDRGNCTYISKSYTKAYAAVCAASSLIGCDIETINYSGGLERLVKKMRFYLPANDIRKILLYDDPHKYATYAWTRKECLFKAHNRRNDIGYVNIANADDVVTLRDMKLVTKNIAENVVLTCYCPIGADIEWVSA